MRYSADLEAARDLVDNVRRMLKWDVREVQAVTFFLGWGDVQRALVTFPGMKKVIISYDPSKNARSYHRVLNLAAWLRESARYQINATVWDETITYGRDQLFVWDGFDLREPGCYLVQMIGEAQKLLAVIGRFADANRAISFYNAHADEIIEEVGSRGRIGLLIVDGKGEDVYVG